MMPAAAIDVIDGDAMRNMMRTTRRYGAAARSALRRLFVSQMRLTTSRISISFLAAAVSPSK